MKLFHRKGLIALLMILALLSSASMAWAAIPNDTTSSQLHKSGEILVQFKDGTSPNVEAKVHQALGASVKETVRQLGTRVVNVPAGKEAAMAKAYANRPEVLFAEPNYTAKTFYVPNDNYYSYTYQTSHFGAINEWGLAKINAAGAWDSTRTLNTNQLIAIIDTGIDYNHPDLAAKVAKDAQGKIIGYNFVAGNTDPKDDNGHGTHVAGIAAAATDNGVGVSGVSFNAVKIMPLKVLDASGSGSYANISSAITWAADNGAKVISMSLGGSAYAQTLQNAINYAWGKGVAVLAAAGNDGRQTIEYPGGNNHVLAISASDSNDALASFSTWGQDVGAASPGTAILSTMPTYSVYLNTTYGYYTNYDGLNGTSMATPMVGGLAALVLANDPTLTNAALIQRIQRTSDNVAGTANGGWDSKFGYGRINANNAVNNLAHSATIGSFYGQVLSKSGLPLSNVTVSAGGVSAKSGSDGMFRLANLPSGNYTITASSSRYGTTSVSSAIVTGADVNLTLSTPN
jgi:thermitase